MEFPYPEVNETIPAVSAEDLKALCNFVRDHMQSAKAFGIDLVRALCSPGADAEAVAWRQQQLWLVTMMSDAFAAFIHDGQPDDKLIALFATFPFRVTERNGSTYKLNWEEFEAEFRKLQDR
jgi:hypothetical protein